MSTSRREEGVLEGYVSKVLRNTFLPNSPDSLALAAFRNKCTQSPPSEDIPSAQMLLKLEEWMETPKTAETKTPQELVKAVLKFNPILLMEFFNIIIISRSRTAKREDATMIGETMADLPAELQLWCVRGFLGDRLQQARLDLASRSSTPSTPKTPASSPSSSPSFAAWERKLPLSSRESPSPSSASSSSSADERKVTETFFSKLPGAPLSQLSILSNRSNRSDGPPTPSPSPPPPRVVPAAAHNGVVKRS